MSAKIFVTGLPPTVNRDTLIIYFQKRKVGGGDIIKVQLLDRHNAAIVEFEKEKTVDSILKHDHVLFGKRIHVERHTMTSLFWRIRNLMSGEKRKSGSSPVVAGSIAESNSDSGKGSSQDDDDAKTLVAEEKIDLWWERQREAKSGHGSPAGLDLPLQQTHHTKLEDFLLGHMESDLTYLKLSPVMDEEKSKAYHQLVSVDNAVKLMSWRLGENVHVCEEILNAVESAMTQMYVEFRLQLIVKDSDKICDAYFALCRYSEAADFCERCIKLVEASDEKSHVLCLANLQKNAGQAYAHLHLLPMARAFYNKALTTYNAVAADEGTQKNIEIVERELEYIEKALHELLPYACQHGVQSKVGIGGAIVTFQDCSIHFPEGSVPSETTICLSLDDSVSQLPSGVIPITPVIKLTPRMTLRREAIVKIGTWCINNGSRNASLFFKETEHASWSCIGSLQLGGEGALEFGISKFCKYCVTVNEDDTDVRFVIESYLFYQQNGRLVNRIIRQCPYMKTVVWDEMTKSNYESACGNTIRLVIDLNDEIKIALRPGPGESFTFQPSHVKFKITHKFLQGLGNIDQNFFLPKNLNGCIDFIHSVMRLGNNSLLLDSIEHQDRIAIGMTQRTSAQTSITAQTVVTGGEVEIRSHDASTLVTGTEVSLPNSATTVDLPQAPLAEASEEWDEEKFFEELDDEPLFLQTSDDCTFTPYPQPTHRSRGGATMQPKTDTGNTLLPAHNGKNTARARNESPACQPQQVTDGAARRKTQPVGRSRTDEGRQLPQNAFQSQHHDRGAATRPTRNRRRANSNPGQLNEIPSGASSLNSVAKEDDVCAICLQALSSSPTKRLPCKHEFHAACVDMATKDRKKCPMCQQPLPGSSSNQQQAQAAAYGPFAHPVNFPPNTFVPTYGGAVGAASGGGFGNQPFGTMTENVDPRPLPGFEGSGTIVIKYSFPSGYQGFHHPNPGVPYARTDREAYLPDTAEGRNLLRMLKVAFDSGLTFTIGRSQSSGKDNQIIWNGIPHKTNREGGRVRYVYGVFSVSIQL